MWLAQSLFARSEVSRGWENLVSGAWALAASRALLVLSVRQSLRRSYHSVFVLFFFFSSRRRHTRFDCDWSSDVCSSDLKPDVVVLDLELTSIKGTQVIAALRDRTTPPKVLVLTAYNDGESLRSALDAGAEGLALKTESPQQTLTAIRQVHAGQLAFPQAARRWSEGRGSAPGDL